MRYVSLLWLDHIELLWGVLLRSYRRCEKWNVNLWEWAEVWWGTRRRSQCRTWNYPNISVFHFSIGRVNNNAPCKLRLTPVRFETHWSWNRKQTILTKWAAEACPLFSFAVSQKESFQQRSAGSRCRTRPAALALPCGELYSHDYRREVLEV